MHEHVRGRRWRRRQRYFSSVGRAPWMGGVLFVMFLGFWVAMLWAFMAPLWLLPASANAESGQILVLVEQPQSPEGDLRRRDS